MSQSLSAQGIRRIRERYGLSQRNFALLLGWSEATLFRYESGASVPDEAHLQVLRLVEEPVNMANLFRQNEARLPEGVRRGLHERLQVLLSEGIGDSLLRPVRMSARLRRPSVYTGYTEFSPEALMNMMLYFIDQDESMFKTKVNKLAFYSDFTFYRYRERSISGSPYIHLPHGPVPDDYDLYISYLHKRGWISVQEVYFENGSGEQLLPREHPPARFTPDQAAVLAAVSRHFQNCSSREIRDLSHQEEAYNATAPGQAISYNYAATLRVNIPVPALFRERS